MESPLVRGPTRDLSTHTRGEAVQIVWETIYSRNHSRQMRLHAFGQYPYGTLWDINLLWLAETFRSRGLKILPRCLISPPNCTEISKPTD